MSQTLCDAALEGNVELLHRLIERDPFILNRPVPTAAAALNSTSTTSLPLHIACRLGHLNFASELLRLRPDLLVMVDLHDQSSSPLHVACKNGHLELVKCLVSVDPNACFLRNSQGWNPVHVAAAKGHCDVLDELLTVCPAAAMETTVGTGQGHGQYFGGGDTIMHLCAKYNQPEAFKLLVEKIHNKNMLDARDGNGNTIFDIAVACKNQKVFDYLICDKRTKHLLGFGGLINTDSRDNALLVVASLIATVALQAGINPPGGVWSDNSSISTRPPGTSIMAQRDKRSYLLFITYNTLGLLSSVISIVMLTSSLQGKIYSTLSVNIALWMALITMTIAYYVELFALSPQGMGYAHHLNYVTFFFFMAFSIFFLHAVVFFWMLKVSSESMIVKHLRRIGQNI